MWRASRPQPALKKRLIQNKKKIAAVAFADVNGHLTSSVIFDNLCFSRLMWASLALMEAGTASKGYPGQYQCPHGYVSVVVVVVAVVVVLVCFNNSSLFMKQLGVTVICNGDSRLFLYNRTNDE